MSANPGKRFEADCKNSFPDYCFVHRLKDSAQSYNNSANTSFSWDNECDFFVFNTKTRLLYAIECKTTKYKSMSVQLSKDDNSSSMVKYHQINSLTKMSEYDGLVTGFFFNFRHFEGEKNSFETMYWQGIEDFNSMMSKTGKKSFNELDLLMNNAIKISGVKKRVRYRWDLKEFFSGENKEDCRDNE